MGRLKTGKYFLFFFIFLLVIISFETTDADSSNPDIDSFSLRNFIDEADRLAFSYAYQQKSLKFDDLAGDYALAKIVGNTPKYIVWTLLGMKKKVEEETRKVLEGRHGRYKELCHHVMDRLLVHEDLPKHARMPSFLKKRRGAKLKIEGRENPLKTDKILQMFSAVIKDETKNGITPKVGRPHEWSSAFKKKYGRRFPAITSAPKSLVALALGFSSRFMITGQEEELIKNLLARPPNSVTLHEMFRASYRLNDGDIYLTLLTIENILSRKWRTEGRENLNIITRLKPITNTYEDRGDKFGAWYHLFGIMLYGYIKGKTQSRLVGNIESLGSSILSGLETETQEDYINSQGGPIGAELKKIVRNQSYKDISPDLIPKVLNENYYLNLTEDYMDRVVLPESTKIQAYIERSYLHIVSTESSLNNCMLTIYPDAISHSKKTAGFDSRLKYIFEKKFSFKKNVKQTVFLFNQGYITKKARIVISGCSDDIIAVTAEKQFDFLAPGN